MFRVSLSALVCLAAIIGLGSIAGCGESAAGGGGGGNNGNDGQSTNVVPLENAHSISGLAGETGQTTVIADADTGGAIAGLVHDADAGTVIPDAQVCVEDYDTGDAYGCATTSPTGHYQIDGLPTGDYRVSAEASGFVAEFYDDAYGWHDADPLPVIAPDVTNLDFGLEPAATVAGTVSDGTNPIADLHVFAEDYATGQWVAGADTDTNGNYALAVPTGTYRIGACASCDGLPYVDEYYDDTYFYSEATPLSVTAPETTSGIDFSLDPPGYITGTVTDGTIGIADLPVFAIDFDTGDWMADAVTDTNGIYALPLPTGTYRVRTCAACWDLPYVDEYYDDTYFDDEATPVSVTAPETTSGIDFSLDAPGYITGTVTDGTIGIADLPVFATDFDTGDWMADVVTDTNGAYALPLPTGTYRVGTCAACWDLPYVDEYYDDTYFDDEATPVSVTAPETTSGIDFSLDAPGYITGTVTDGTNGIADLLVYATDFETGELSWEVDTDTNGNYALAVPTGTYRIRACPSCDGLPYVDEYYDDTYFDDEATPVSVTAPGTAAGIDFALGAAGYITGTVTDGTSPIADLHVAAEDYATGQWGVGANTDVDGNYTLFVPTGTYRVRACPSCSELPYIDEYYDDTYFHSEATPVSVTAPETTSGIDFSLDAPGYITGTVTDGASGIADLHVFATDFDTGDWMAGADTDTNGNYVLPLPTGTYRVGACSSCSGLPYVNEYYDDTYSHPDATPVSVTAPDPTSGIDFVLEMGGSISGFVYSEDGTIGIADVDVWVSGCGEEWWGWEGSSTTSEDGGYTVTGLPTGAYYVETGFDFCASGVGYVGEIYDDTHNHDHATCVPVTLPEDTPGIDFYLASITLQARPTVDESIDDGIAWLAATQNPDGSWGNEYHLAATGLSVLNLETYALDQFLSPLDPAYVYSAQVQAGLDFIFQYAEVMDLGTSGQFAGDPDGNTNGTAVYFSLDGYDVYNTSIDMMAIAASNAPDALVTVPSSPVNGWTYGEVLEDVVDWIAWAQTDVGWGKGGWNYGGMDNEGDRSDQSNSGWASIALAHAEDLPPRGFGVSPVGFVRSELDVWINATQHDVDGGSVYSPDPSQPDDYWSNSLRTGNMVQQMAFVGDVPATPRVQDALAYLIAHWDEPNSNPGWRGGCPVSYQTTYTIMKGLIAFDLEFLDSINWFQDFADALLPQQTVEGGWPIANWDRDNGTLSTNWALLTLQEGAVIQQPFQNLAVIAKHEEWVPGQEGTQYVVHFDVQNQGNVPSLQSEVELAIDDVEGQREDVPALAVDEIYSGVFSASITISGDCDDVRVCVDPDNSIAEKNEDDNCQANTWWAPRPDLIAEKHEEWVVPGVTYTVHYTLQNIGDETALPGHDAKLTVDHVVLEYREVDVALAPGETYSDAFAAVIILTDGMDRVEVDADANEEVEESDEGNNHQLNWIPWPPAPDLVVHEAHEEWLVPGQSYFVHYEVQNIGNAAAAAGHDASLEVDGTIVETQQVPVSLAPGASYAGVFAALITLTEGLDVASVCADVNEEVAEHDEDDNCYVWTVDWPPAPDLQSVDKFETWVVGYENERYTVGVSVGNFGNAVAEAGHWAELSVDGVVVEIKEIPVDLAPTASYALVFDAVIEISGECDDITVCADADDDVTESDETNNCATNVWCVGPEPPLTVPVDIKPTSCPNPLNLRSKGVLPVAVLGTGDFDVTRIDAASVSLLGVEPLRWSWEDVARPYEPFVGKQDCYDCTEDGADGFMDLTLKFDRQAIVAALGDVAAGDCVVVTLEGQLLDEHGGTPFAGEDVLRIR